MIGLVGTLIFAIPVANFGVWRLLDGQVSYGVALIGIAVAMVAVPQYVLDPGRMLGRLISGLLPSLGRSDPTTSDESAGED
ncbi:MAG: hypothetical protein A07HR60_01033 [uncultured archaeon A07HR60]|nr:MAG: hypothetical protein A07HR60_01033 [uncultured archaeon A07HR60]